MRRYSAAVVIALTLASPNFKIDTDMPALRAEDIALVIFLLAGRPFGESRQCDSAERSRIRRAFWIMMLIAALSIAASPLLYGCEVIGRDWMILPMLFRYLLVFSVGQSLDGRRSRIWFIGVALASFGLCGVLGVLEWLGVRSVNEWSAQLYGTAGDLFVSSSGAATTRAAGTHGDPRYFGMLLVCGLGVALPALLIATRRTIKDGAKILIGIITLALMMTLSRTAVLSAIIVIFVALYLRYRNRAGALVAGTMMILGFGAALIIALRVASPDEASAIEERVFDRDTTSFANSKAARLRDLVTPFTDAMRQPSIFLLGRGPSKSVLRTSSHNDIGWFFHRFGLPGLAFYLSLLVWGLRKAYRGYVSHRGHLERVVYMSSFLIMITWSIMMWSESVWKDPQLMTVFILFLGAAHAPIRSPDQPRATCTPGQKWPALSETNAAGGAPLVVGTAESVTYDAAVP